MPENERPISEETGVEVQEVAEPVVETGAEEQEVAEPATEGRTEADSAFAELRRRAEAAERTNAELESQNQQMIEALGLYFEGGNPTDLSINARAHARNVSPEEERARYNEELRAKSMTEENEQLKQRIMDLEVQQLMSKGLSEIQAIDPSVKSLEDLGDTFAGYIRAGLSSTDAYYAVKARETSEKIVPPKTIGKVATAKGESGFFTKDEVEAMSDEDLEKNWDDVWASQKFWK